MAVFKCKMCGAPLEIEEGATIVKCKYCRAQQTLPRLDDDRRANLYDRANHFRRNNEFDKAMGIYEQILAEDKTDAEAYWSIILCRYGIEYVEDPATKERIPTVNRAQFTSIFDDDNYKSALEYADPYQKTLYEAEAKAINEIQKGILAISQKEEPFDVFICYKETDQNGRRTPDSVLAQELYYELKKEGFKVFFARITLEDKLGSAYEPYIFAALNSAKVMVAIGTKAEYLNAVWVKNEWSRYLALIKNGAQKTLIPAYRDMDPYDLPEEFSHLQAQDMSKLGFMQDLIRGIKKILGATAPKTTVVKETVVATSAMPNIEPLIKRMFMFLEDGEFDRADEFCEQILNQDPENATAYVGKLMAELKVSKRENLAIVNLPFDENINYKKAIRFADRALHDELTGYIEQIKQSIYQEGLNYIKKADQEAFLVAAQSFDLIIGFKDADIMAEQCRAYAETEKTYCLALEKMQAKKFEEAIAIFETISTWKDSESLIQKCIEDFKDRVYAVATSKMTQNTISACEGAIFLLSTITDWKDAKHLIDVCQKKIEELKAQAEADRIEKERLAKIRAKRIKKIAIIALSIVCAIIVCLIIWSAIAKSMKYNEMLALKESNEVVDAYLLCQELGDYKDCSNISAELKPTILKKAEDLYFSGEVHAAAQLLSRCNIEDPGYSLVAGGNYQSAINKGLTDIVIPNGVTSISTVAFSGYSRLTSITIPDSVTSIGSSAFYNCTSLESITLPFVGSSKTNASYTYFGYIFGALSYSDNSNYVPTSLKTVVITGGTSIGEMAFYDCSSLTSITIPDSVTSIGERAFFGCSSLTSITIPDSVTSIGGVAFYNCSSLTSITIPDRVTSIGYSAFYKCSGLTSITIPDSVTSIGYSAFRECISLTSITIPDGVTSIDARAFFGCSSLTSVTFENPNGWWHSSSSTATSGTTISSSDLSNTTTASTYLTSTYAYRYWGRS